MIDLTVFQAKRNQGKFLPVNPYPESSGKVIKKRTGQHPSFSLTKPIKLIKPKPMN
jgi:hypothetical protein